MGPSNTYDPVLLGFVVLSRRVGTGSYPPSHQGWQHDRRFAANKLPLIAPCSRTASAAYCEHEGSNRQRGPSHGLIRYWYARTNHKSKWAIGDMSIHLRYQRWSNRSYKALATPRFTTARIQHRHQCGLKCILMLGLNKLCLGIYRNQHISWQKPQSMLAKRFSNPALYSITVHRAFK